MWNHQVVLTGLRFLLSFAILLLPATAMGLTLPLVVEDPILRESDFGRAVGLLYGCNTLGAVAGALLAEAFLIRDYGIFGSSLIAGSLNCVAGAAVLLLARTKIGAETGSSGARRLTLKLNYHLPWRLLITSFGAGGVLLALEVIWFRFLHLYVASSSIAFSIMLAVVLAGIGLGVLTYLYCLNGSVEKAEAWAAAYAESIKNDSFVAWLWGRLQTEFGFHPPD